MTLSTLVSISSFNSKCSKVCKTSCEESNFYARPLSKKVILRLKQKYTTYVNDPLMSFTAFLSTTGGLLGLWNNVSINDMQTLLLSLANKFFGTQFMIIVYIIFHYIPDSFLKD
jgi:hypothetical protein